MSMPDYDAPKGKNSSDWSGAIICAMLLPVFIYFVHIDKPEMGFTAIIVLGLIILAIRFRWKLRKHLWFWGAIGFVLFLHIPLLFFVHWPQTNVPTIVYSMPFG